MTIACSSAVMSTGALPRYPSSSRDTLVLWIMERASAWLSGGKSTATSRYSSTPVPPMPNMSAGPKVGSFLEPMMTS